MTEVIEIFGKCCQCDKQATGYIHLVDEQGVDAERKFFCKDHNPEFRPIEPSIGLLMSMALRFDHAIGHRGYYGTKHPERLEGSIRTMRQLYEEVVGQGFYSPANEDFYVKLYNSAIIPLVKEESND